MSNTQHINVFKHIIKERSQVRKGEKSLQESRIDVYNKATNEIHPNKEVILSVKILNFKDEQKTK